MSYANIEKLSHKSYTSNDGMSLLVFFMASNIVIKYRIVCIKKKHLAS